jgi:hypothetical protein
METCPNQLQVNIKADLTHVMQPVHLQKMETWAPWDVRAPNQVESRICAGQT